MRLRVWGAALVAVLIGSSVLSSSPATAVTATGTIAGTVKNVNGDPIAGAYALIYDYDPGDPETGDPLGYATTDSSGQFSAGGLTPGTYKLHVAPGSNPYVGEWYQDKKTYATATNVVAPNGGQNSYQVVLTSSLGQIAGTVTGANGPLSGVTVQAHPYDDPATSSYAPATTDGSGHYSLSVPPGAWRVSYTAPDPYDTTWNGAHQFPADAPAVTVASAEATTVDVTMLQLERAHGRVTAEDTDQPLAARVEVWDYDRNVMYDSTTTASDGTYTVRGLPRLDTDEAYWNGILLGVRVIPLVAGYDRGEVWTDLRDDSGWDSPSYDKFPGDFALKVSVPGDAKIHGTVSPPVPGVKVSADAYENHYETLTDSNGQWSMDVQHSDWMSVTFTPNPDQVEYVAKTVYSSAVPFYITAGHDTRVDGSPVRVDAITGMVTDPDGRRVSRGTAELWGRDSAEGDLTLRTSGPISMSGKYGVKLTGCCVDVQVRILPSDPRLAVTWVGGNDSPTRLAPADASNVNAVLTAGGGMRGVVSGEGVPQADVPVVVSDPTNEYVFSTTTDVNGLWHVDHLPPAMYKAKVGDSSDWFTTWTDFYAVNAGAVTAIGTSTVLPAATLEVRPWVTNEGDVDRSFSVRVWSPSGVLLDHAEVAQADRRFTQFSDSTLTRLSPQAVKVEVVPNDPSFASVWFGGEDLASATVFDLSRGYVHLYANVSFPAAPPESSPSATPTESVTSDPSGSASSSPSPSVSFPPVGDNPGGPVIVHTVPSLLMVGVPKVTGKSKVGKTLRLSKVAWTLPGTRTAIVWMVGTKVVGHGTLLKLKRAWVHKKVTIVITGTGRDEASQTYTIQVRKAIGR